MPGAGPTKVVTNKAVLEPEPDSGELVLTALYPGVELDDVTQCIGWPLRTRDNLATIDPPTERDLYLLREVLDPDRVYLQ